MKVATNIYFGGHSHPKGQVKPLELLDVTDVGGPKFHAKAALNHPGQSPESVDEGETIQKSIYRLFLKFLLQSIHFLQKHQTLVSLVEF